MSELSQKEKLSKKKTKTEKMYKAGTQWEKKD